jgi:hypothetical protein
MKSKKTNKKEFNKRALTALIALISGISLPFTGLAIHLFHSGSPEGPRHFWIAAHEALGIIFTISTLWHIFLNRKALYNHLRGAAGQLAGVSRETLCAIALVAVILFVAAGHSFLVH